MPTLLMGLHWPLSAPHSDFHPHPHPTYPEETLMDPNAALAALRSLVTSYRNGGKWDEADTDDLVERIGALDDWLVKGGFLPDAWDTERPRHGFVPQSTLQEFCAAPDDQDGTDLCGLPKQTHGW